MKLEQLSEIIEVANAGSFSEAARVLYLSQPNLSRSVKQLEEELGFDIFIRKSSGVILTEKGRDLIERARVIERECQHLSDLYGAETVAGGQCLRVATLHCRITALLPPMIPKYVGMPVNFTFLNCTDLEEIIHLVKTLQVDYASIGVLSSYIPEIRRKLQNADMEYNVLSKSDLYAAVSPHNPLYRQAEESVALSQLQPYTVISYTDISGDSNSNFAVALGLDKRTRGSIKTNNAKIFYQTIHQTAAVGIVAIPPKKFQEYCEYDDLRLLSLPESRLFVEYIWTKLRRVPLSDLAYEDLNSKNALF